MLIYSPLRESWWPGHYELYAMSYLHAHDDTGDSPTMDISTSSLDVNHVSRLDRVSSDTEVNSVHESSVDHDSCHGSDTDPRSEHGDAPDDSTDDDPDDIKPDKSQDWEPPPGWCWRCWFAKPDTCDQHS